MQTPSAIMRRIPAIDRLLAAAAAFPELAAVPRELLVGSLRQAAEIVRGEALAGKEVDTTPAAILGIARRLLAHAGQPSLRRVINATGVVLHTNLGRAPLSRRARERVADVMAGYSTLEYDLAGGERGSRYSHVAARIAALTGAEDVIVVNNNAAGVMLVLSALARGREVIVSRGQLVEIGGSFRVPDVMAQSGATLVEVGTTNKTHLHDYERAIGPSTAAILKVHTSNYRIVGFTAQPEDGALATLARQHGLPLIEDLGSGTIRPVEADGWREPAVSERLAAGMDIVTFSGDKLFGGPQAGVIAGKKELVDTLRRHPLLRAIRVDKLTLAAFEGTLLDYLLGEPEHDIPVLSMLQAGERELADKSAALAGLLGDLPGWRAEVVPLVSRAGGGALPAVDLPGWGVRVRPERLSADAAEEKLRLRALPIIVRVKDDCLLFDVRCLAPEDLAEICGALEALAAEAAL
ncbi:L-seryl-tRNA(Sec) selenium transferase [Anaeroselena agilis]|uniref:L-seryl-tRNA(Sec) selenium transferase n=1 Tax=Anaeroselena agilis TaxID=3063788 RepID=A0ABU3P5D1_9FIRM|nr:L-seryl-tRNA(Sec) selenium transferase [Selenomonadales bacterium 4137-cl]